MNGFFTFTIGLLVHFSQNHVHSEIITNLPGLDTPINFKQYSGYITVDPENGTRLFYWYVESQSDPSNDPLVLWLNGGPGCSSLGGFLGELGPFYVKPNITLGINEYSWNKIANMIFLEAPAGVGFSKTNKQIQYNDERTASDSLKFLLNFLKKYPHLKSNDFWMAGESYAGHFIPTLAAKIIKHNHQVSSKDDAINLKGLMIGNGLTVGTIDFGATFDNYFDHQLISIPTYAGLKQHCNLTMRDPPPHREINPIKCAAFQRIAAENIGPINYYAIYADVCSSDQRYSYSNGEALLKYLAHSNSEMSAFARGVFEQMKINAPYYPCQDIYIPKYLNDPAVQKAIHAESSEWIDCYVSSTTLDYDANDLMTSMLPIYRDILIPEKLRILIYSGDTDSVISTTGTRRWGPTLPLKDTVPWQPWMDSRGQVGGYIEMFDHFAFTTVRGAGHQVPSFQPRRAFDMFSRFLKGTK